MKIFKFKLNFFFNIINKSRLYKFINIFFSNLKNLTYFDNLKKKITVKYNKFHYKKFKINYIIFFASILFFYYLIYLSFPGILHNKSDQNYFNKILNEQFGLEFALTPEINYSILPKPHFEVKDVIIFNKNNNFQKEIAQIKKLKIYLNQNNFFRKQNLEIKSIELFESNFFLNKNDIVFVKNFFKKGFFKKNINIKKAKLFYQDIDKGTISFLNFKKINIFQNNKTNQDVFASNGKIYNIPFNLTWKNDLNKFEQDTNLKFKRIKLQVINSIKLINEKKVNKLQIYLNRSRYIINYNLNKKEVNFFSNNSFIGNNKLIFKGNVFSDPFNFDIQSSLDNLKLKKFISNNMFLKEILSEDFILNENFNGKIKFTVNKLDENPLFNSLDFNVNFIGNTLDLSSSSLNNEKIGNLIFNKGTIYQDQNDLIFKGDLDFIINDINKFNNKFVIPKKNRVEIKKLNFEIIVNLTNLDIKILKIINDNFKDKEFEELDNLIYEFNSGAIKISNWIEFKIFTNKIISSYSG